MGCDLESDIAHLRLYTKLREDQSVEINKQLNDISMRSPDVTRSFPTTIYLVSQV